MNLKSKSKDFLSVLSFRPNKEDSLPLPVSIGSFPFLIYCHIYVY